MENFNPLFVGDYFYSFPSFFFSIQDFNYSYIMMLAKVIPQYTNDMFIFKSLSSVSFLDILLYSDPKELWDIVLLFSLTWRRYRTQCVPIYLLLLGPVLSVNLNLIHQERSYHRKSPLIQQLYIEWCVWSIRTGDLWYAKMYNAIILAVQELIFKKGKINK